MLDIDFEEALVEKVGGKFALTSLIQKRMVELNRGAPPLIPVEGDLERDYRRIACTEIIEGKIELAPAGQIQAPPKAPEAVPEPEAPAAEPQQEEAAGGEIYGSDIKKLKEQRIKELAALLNPKKEEPEEE